MLFTTDKQTLDDLNIFGKHGGDSIFRIFDRTGTRGGAAILEDLFRYPMSHPDTIHRRSAIIRQFAETGLAFPFAPALFDAIGSYLSNTDERTKLQTEDRSVTTKLSQLIAVDSETAVIYKGVTALAELLKEAKAFADTPLPRADTGSPRPESTILSSVPLNPISATSDPYAEERSVLLALLAEPDLAPVIAHPGKGKLSHNTIAAFDVLLRFRHRETIQKLLQHLYRLDVYCSVARVARERNFVFPTALPKDRHIVSIEGVYHPQVNNAVPNSIRIDSSGNVLFLTGANMAGKSTFMKSLSIALFLAHMGFPVPAARMDFSVLDGMYTTINLPDNLGMGASHFYAEVLRVKKVAGELQQGKNLFIVFDELFRGTNVKDAYEATVAFTKAFARKRNSLFIISTHIIEAGDVIKDSCDNVSFVYLPTLMEGNRPVYTYRLEKGITADRHGMVIINNEGILDMLKKGLPVNN